MAALLHHVSVHPHAVVRETLGLISSKVLGHAQGLPPHVQAEAFSDAALLQASPCPLVVLPSVASAITKPLFRSHASLFPFVLHPLGPCLRAARMTVQTLTDHANS